MLDAAQASPIGLTSVLSEVSRSLEESSNLKQNRQNRGQVCS